MKLYKTTVVVWSKIEPDPEMDLETLGRKAGTGRAYCSRWKTQLVEDVESDPEYPPRRPPLPRPPTRVRRARAERER